MVLLVISAAKIVFLFIYIATQIFSKSFFVGKPDEDRSMTSYNLSLTETCAPAFHTD